MLQITGINGLKAAGGTFAFNSGAYDSVSKVYFLAPGPDPGHPQDVHRCPRPTSAPSPGCPANVASYQTLSWDLDGAYNALNDLVNQFQPGMLQVLQQQLVGPNGGEPLDLQKDIFGPLGDRLTVDHRLQEADQGGQPADPLRRRPDGRQEVPGHPQQDHRDRRRRPRQARLPGHDDLRLQAPRDAQPAPAPTTRSRAARSAWRSPRTPCSSPPSRPCWSRSSAAAARPWPTAPSSRPSPSRSPPRPAASPTPSPTSRPAPPTTASRAASSRSSFKANPNGPRPQQALRQVQAARLLRLRQVPHRRRRLRPDGGRRRDLHQLHPPQGQPLIQAVGLRGRAGSATIRRRRRRRERSPRRSSFSNGFDSSRTAGTIRSNRQRRPSTSPGVRPGSAGDIEGRRCRMFDRMGRDAIGPVREGLAGPVEGRRVGSGSSRSKGGR